LNSPFLGEGLRITDAISLLLLLVLIFLVEVG
jgi:hypothetical protein